jgi:hypothetical protein
MFISHVPSRAFVAPAHAAAASTSHESVRHGQCPLFMCCFIMFDDSDHMLGGALLLLLLLLLQVLQQLRWTRRRQIGSWRSSWQEKAGEGRPCLAPRQGRGLTLPSGRWRRTGSWGSSWRKAAGEGAGEAALARGRCGPGTARLLC